MKTLHLLIIGILMITLLLPSGVAFAQSQQNFPGQIAPPAPDKIGCYNYTKETGWLSTPCMNTSQTTTLSSMGPLPVENSSKRFDIKLDFFPGDILVNTNLIYVAHLPGNSISVISTLTNKTVSTITVENDPGRIAFNPSNNMIYVSNTNSHSISVISNLTNKVVATIQVGQLPRQILVNPNTNMIYVANEESNTVSVISGATNTVVATLKACNLWGTSFAINESTNTIYLDCTGPAGAIDVISGSTNDLLYTIPVGHDPTNLVFNPRTNMLYTANNGDYTVSVVSGSDHKLVDTIPVETFPNFIALNPDTNMIYVTSDNYGSHKLSVISGITNKVTSTIDIGLGSSNIAIDHTNNIIYVLNYVANSVSVISGNTNTVIDTIPVGANPSFIAINDITKTVYISNFKSDIISVIPFSNLDLQVVPEFPFAVPILLISITSLIVFYRMKFRI
jgi:YVTN family beta-propeller protein